MALYSVCSVRSSPGVTSAAAGLALTWPRARRFVAECDPSGGDLAGWFALSDAVGVRTLLPDPRGLAGEAGSIDRALCDLFQPDRGVAASGYEGAALPALFGLSDPDRYGADDSLAEGLAEAFASWDGDVVADLGRLAPMARGQAPFLRRSCMVLVVARPDAVHGRALRDRRELLRTLNGDVRLVVVGRRPYAPRELVEFAGLPLAGALPEVAGATGPDLPLARSRKLRKAPLLPALERLAAAVTGSVAGPVAEPQPPVGARIAGVSPRSGVSAIGNPSGGGGGSAGSGGQALGGAAVAVGSPGDTAGSPVTQGGVA